MTVILYRAVCLSYFVGFSGGLEPDDTKVVIYLGTGGTISGTANDPSRA